MGMRWLGRAGVVMLTTAWLAAGPGSAAADAASWVKCPALSASGGSLRTLPDAAVITGGGGEQTVFFIRTRGTACPQVQQVLAAVLQSGDESTALGTGGYRLLQAHREQPLAGHAAYSVEAGRGAARLRYWRFGARIDIDHSIFRPGQWIDMPLTGKVGYEACTASWVLEPRGGQPLMAVTAGHCAPVFDQVYREVQGGPTTLLGSVSGRAPDVDAEVFTLEAPSGWAQQVERGGNPPKTAVGWLPTRDQHKGDRVCFAGRTTGADQCGKIVKRYSLVSKTQLCTDIEGHQGDSGGPVYTETDGATTRAVGIVAVVVRRGLTGRHRKMCYVPIESILDAFQANSA
jgi:hypothetical protein